MHHKIYTVIDKYMVYVTENWLQSVADTRLEQYLWAFDAYKTISTENDSDWNAAKLVVVVAAVQLMLDECSAFLVFEYVCTVYRPIYLVLLLQGT